jgi:hypothetical protein
MTLGRLLLEGYAVVSVFLDPIGLYNNVVTYFFLNRWVELRTITPSYS